MKRNRVKANRNKWLVNFGLIALMLLAFWIFYPKEEVEVEGSRNIRVTQVIDGDTFKVGGEKIRMIGINCPETNPNDHRGVEYMGIDAKNYVRDLIKGKTVKLEFDEELHDQYGRTLAYVFLEDGTLLNEDLIERGLAHVYTFPPNTKYLDRFEKAERRAQKKGIGIWNDD